MQLGVWRRAAWAAALALFFSLPATGFAEPAAAPARASRADTDIVREAMALAAPPLGAKGVAPKVPELRGVLDRAPATYPKVEIQGDRAVVRAMDPMEGMALSLGATHGKLPGLGKVASAVQEFPTYMVASLLLASYANETGDYAAAISYLDRGLALQPNDAILTGEKAAALGGLGRHADSLVMLDAWFAAKVLATPEKQARLHRARGFALIELGRLEEAEQAYRKSLELRPGHPGAQQELAYIVQLRTGGPKAGTALTTAGKAAGVE